ncbi:hypothetical protein ACFLZZ_00145 [Nanoarchaeota archaeon]
MNSRGVSASDEILSKDKMAENNESDESDINIEDTYGGRSRPKKASQEALRSVIDYRRKRIEQEKLEQRNRSLVGGIIEGTRACSKIKEKKHIMAREIILGCKRKDVEFLCYEFNIKGNLDRKRSVKILKKIGKSLYKEDAEKHQVYSTRKEGPEEFQGYMESYLIWPAFQYSKVDSVKITTNKKRKNSKLSIILARPDYQLIDEEGDYDLGFFDQQAGSILEKVNDYIKKSNSGKKKIKK